MGSSGRALFQAVPANAGSRLSIRSAQEECMKTRQTTHQISQSAAKYLDGKLGVLLAKELGYETRPKGCRNWLQPVFGLALFIIGMTIVIHERTGNQNTDVSAGLPKVYKEQLLAEQIGEHRNIQAAEIRGLIAEWSNPSPVNVRFTSSLSPFHSPVEAASAALPHRTAPSTRRVLSSELELELKTWRPAAHSNEPKLYKTYLRRYPSGTFAAIAAARLKSLDRSDTSNVAKDGAARKNKAKKSSSGDTAKQPAKLAEATVPVKPPVRCSNFNNGACRQPCRNGDMRSCSKLRRSP
jgi:hypothetical protein